MRVTLPQLNPRASGIQAGRETVSTGWGREGLQAELHQVGEVFGEFQHRQDPRAPRASG